MSDLARTARARRVAALTILNGPRRDRPMGSKLFRRFGHPMGRKLAA
ncbi:MAG: hypothetical protein QNJ09_04885 [Paracoccaceae bacterium]|nr:hypothetical protein [Paracoccaceae bacterium]